MKPDTFAAAHNDADELTDVRRPHHPHVDRHNAGARAEAIVAGHSVVCAEFGNDAGCPGPVEPAQRSLPLPPPSLRHAWLGVAEAALALSKNRGDAVRRERARLACQVLGRTLEERGYGKASAEAWIMARHVAEPQYDGSLEAIEARCRELAVDVEETADGERTYDTEPCSLPGCELCLCPCGLPRSDAYHTPEQRAACREAFGDGGGR